ncbi:MAG: endo alpha-1,4 polygalactosaminidase [Verrucomicrobia bacterium]|nr:endo alpha-1,4 polygalactosaminidase [Verrucomicrobiota bacterium]
MMTANSLPLPWIAYYGDGEPAEAFLDYQVIVFDPVAHPLLDQLLDKKKDVLGYLNLAEASEKEGVFERLGAKGLLIQENQDWPGDWAVDLRDAFWQTYILEEAIPSILQQGFVGLLLDQVDVALDLEKADPLRYQGMREAAIKLVKAIHSLYPSIHLMLNRAYELLAELGTDIYYELAETLYSFYNFQTKKYEVRTEEGYRWQYDQLKQAKQKFVHLELCSLDYWDPQDVEMYKKIYALEAEHGLHPCVATPWLNRLPPISFKEQMGE